MKICPTILSTGSCSDTHCPHYHNVFGCDTCCQVFKRVSVYRDHYDSQKHKKNISAQESPPPRVRCPLCDCFTIAANWRHHKKSKKHLEKASALNVSANVRPETDTPQGIQRFCTSCQTHVLLHRWEEHTESGGHKRGEKYTSFKLAQAEAEKDQSGVRIQGDLDLGTIGSDAASRSVTKSFEIYLTTPTTRIKFVSVQTTAESRFSHRTSRLLSPFIAVAEGTYSARLSLSHPLRIHVTFKEERPGQYRDRIQVRFEDLDLRKQFSISRTVQVTVEDTTLDGQPNSTSISNDMQQEVQHATTRMLMAQQPTTKQLQAVTNELSKQVVTINHDGTITNANNFEYTASPEGGFPNPALGAYVSMHINKMQWHAWNNEPELKIWVRLWRARWTESGMETYRSRILSILGALLGRQNVNLSTPILAASAGRERYDPPWHFLAYNLTKKGDEMIQDIPITASKMGTIFTMPLAQPIPRYLTSITNMSCANDEEGKEAILNAVISTLVEALEIANFIKQRAGSRAYDEFIAGLEVKCLEMQTQRSMRPKTWWNIYSAGMPNFQDFNDYTKLREFLSETPFRTEDNGTGRAGNPFECANCKSLDHPAVLCPLYDVLGWLGPSRDGDFQAKMHSKRGRAGGGGGGPPSRGRGLPQRGRGSRG